MVETDLRMTPVCVITLTDAWAICEMTRVQKLNPDSLAQGVNMNYIMPYEHGRPVTSPTLKEGRISKNPLKSEER